MTGAILIYAAYGDLKRFQIRNELVGLLAALYVLHAFLSGRWGEIPWNAALAFVLLIAMLYCYSRNLMGGGDVKLLTVAFLWVGLGCALPFAVLLSLCAAIHALAGRLGWVAVQGFGEDRRPRIPLAPSVAAALIGVFLLGCLAPAP